MIRIKKNEFNLFFYVLVSLLLIIVSGCKNPTTSYGQSSIIGDEPTGLKELNPITAMELEPPVLSPSPVTNPSILINGVKVTDHVALYNDSRCSNELVRAAWGGQPIDEQGWSSVILQVPSLTVGPHRFYAKRFWTEQGLSSPCSEVFLDYEVTAGLTVTGLVNDLVPRQIKAWAWNCTGEETSCEYRFVVNQNSTHNFTNEPFSAATTSTSQNSGDGLYYIHVQARDATFTNLLSPVSTRSAVLDNTLPTVSITYFPDIIASNELNYFFSGTCSEDGQNVQVSVGGLNSTVTCLLGAWSSGFINVSGLADGSTSLTADTIDVALNSATQASLTVQKISTPIVSITSLENVTSANVTSYSISGLCSENSISVTLNFSSSGGGGPLSRSIICSSGTWSSGTIDLSALLDGTITVTADHSTAPQNIQTATKDVTSPTVNINSNSLITSQNEMAYIVSGTCSEDSQAVVYDIGGLTGTVTCSTGGWTSGFIDVSSLADGNVSLTVDHSTAPQDTATVLKNTNLPTVFSPQSGEVLSQSIGLSWSITNPNNETINDYVISYRIKGTPTFLSYNDGANINQFVTITGLTASTTYEFKIFMVYAGTQNSEDSTILEVTTQPSNPLFGPNVAVNVGGATESIVIASADNTNITLNSGFLVTLQAGQIHTFSSAPYDVIDADKPIYTNGKKIQGVNVGDAVWMPSSWAGKEFSFNATRNANTVIFIFAIEDSSVEVKSGATTLASTTLTAGNSGSLNWGALGSYQIYSTGSILLFSQNNNLIDTKPVLPVANELIGFPSSSMRITSILNDTNYNFFHSNSTTGFGSLQQTTSQQVNPQNCGSGTARYTSCTLLVSSDKQISGASYADGDGGNAAPFLPTGFMKRFYSLPAFSEYLAFASKEPGTIQVIDNSDRLVETLSLVRSGGQAAAPFQARLASQPAGYRYLSTVPTAAWYQASGDVTGAFALAEDDETIIYGTNEVPNFKPFLSAIAKQGGLINQQVGPVSFVVKDVDGGLDCSSSVSISSDNTTLIDNSGVVFSGVAPNCAFTLNPFFNQSGLANLTLSVFDGVNTTNTSFEYSVSDGLSLDMGSYRFADNSAATSCLAYLQHAEYAGEGDATYWLDHDGAGGLPEFEAFCDMTTQGGGWTLVIKYDRDQAAAGSFGLDLNSGRISINPNDLLNLNTTGNLTASFDIRPFIVNGASHFMHIAKPNDGVNNSSTYVHQYFSDIYQSVIDDPDRLFDSTLDTNDAELVAGVVVQGTSLVRKDQWYDADFILISSMFDIDSSAFSYRLDGGEGLAMFTNGSREGAVYASGNSSTADGHSNPLVQWGFRGKDNSLQSYGGSIYVGTHCKVNDCIPPEAINLMFVR